jgi:hypothetical protein
MELLYKLWKHYGRIDEWRTANPWRVLCELYAKLIGLLLHHWLMLLFAWHDEQRSLVKLARGASATPLVLSWKLWLEAALCGRPCGPSDFEWDQERR